MNRRSVLRVTGSIGPLGLGGCLSGAVDEQTASDATTSATADESSTESPTSEPSDAEETSSTASGSLSVGFDRLQSGVVLAGDDSIGVDSDGRQFLYLDVETETSDASAADAPTFRFAGETHSSWRASEHTPLWRAWTSGDDEGYTAESGSGWMLFELPERGDASDAALDWKGLEWQPPESLRARLAARPPSLSLDWSVPETTTPGETEIGFEVTNDGDHVGRFVAGLNETNIRTAYTPIEAFSRPIQPGETVSWTITHDNGVTPGSDSVDDGDPDGSYVLSWQGGRRKREISFVSDA